MVNLSGRGDVSTVEQHEVSSTEETCFRATSVSEQIREQIVGVAKVILGRIWRSHQTWFRVENTSTYSIRSKKPTVFFFLSVACCIGLCFLLPRTMSLINQSSAVASPLNIPHTTSCSHRGVTMIVAVMTGIEFDGDACSGHCSEHVTWFYLHVIRFDNKRQHNFAA